MMTLRGQRIMRNILIYIAVVLTLLSLSACGGGGGGNTVAPPSAKTTAALTINLTGTLPANTTIAGTDFTLTLPANVTPELANGSVATSVVSLSGTFAGGTQTPPVYTPATTNAPGTLKVVLANPVNTGVNQVGEIATITLQLTNGATPTASSFGVNAVSVIDATLYNTINSMGVSVTNVTLE